MYRLKIRETSENALVFFVFRYLILRGARRGSTVYISKAALEDGRWADTLLEEAAHFSQGSREHFALGKFLAGQTDIMDEVRAELSEEGNPYGFTEEDTKALREGRSREFGNEMVAHAAAKILDTPRYVERLVRADRTLAEKIRNRVEDVKAALESLGSRASRRAYNRLQRTAQLFENALEGGGQIVAGRIEKGEEGEKEESEAKFSIKNTRNMDWKQQIEGVIRNNGTIKHSDTLVIGSPSVFLKGKGISEKVYAVPISVITKAKSGKDFSHSISDANLEKLSGGIQSAPIIIDNPERNALVFVTNIKQNGSPVLIAFQKDTEFDGEKVHKATSIHLQMNVDAMLRALPENATIYSKNKSEFTAAVGTENNLPGYAARIEFADNSIAQNSEKSTPDGDFSLENVPEEANQQTSGDLEGKISSGMTDVQRYNILKNRVIEGIPTVNASPENAIIQSWGEVNALLGKEKRALIRSIANKLHVFGKSYTNADIDISFEFSRNNFEESYSKQMHNYEEFAKMFSVFSSVIEQGICIEVHKREDYKPDPTLKNVHVMASAFRDGEYVVPVKLEVKEFTDKPSKLYVAIALEKIKMTEVSEQGNTKNGVTQDSRSVTISIADLLRNVNPSDVNFYKYIPKEFFSEEDTELKSPEFQGTEKTISELNEDEIEEVISLIRKTPYKLSKAQKTRAAEHYGSFEVVRKQLFGRTSLRKTTAKRVPMLAEQWKEWSRVLPKIFDKTVPNRDKGVVLADIVNQLYSARESTGAAKIKKKYREAYARQKEHMREELAQEKAAFDSKIEEAEARYKENDFRIKISQEIQRIVKEIQERKEGYFRAGSTRRSAEVLEFVDKLSQINYSRMLTGSVRNIFRGFRDWFTPQNEALSEWFENEEHAKTGRDIMDMLSAIFSFLTNYREGRRMPFSFFGHIHENVEQYFQKEY
ncbi:MAG: hypothetical protein IJW97_02980 [Clostridia bacterium]|nr:hypothetical protein [Clostridia bacterium]